MSYNGPVKRDHLIVVLFLYFDTGTEVLFLKLQSNLSYNGPVKRDHLIVVLFLYFDLLTRTKTAPLVEQNIDLSYSID